MPQDAYDFTPSQTRDLLSLRRLFYGRIGQLVRERQALLAKMPVAGEITQRMKSQPVKVSFHEARYLLHKFFKARLLVLCRLICCICLYCCRSLAV